MAFRLTLSADLRSRIDAENREAMRLYGLPDRWLARELLKLVRGLRVFPRVWLPHENVYDAVLFWHLVPEVAHRLGERSFVLNERSEPEIVALSDEDLRFRAANAWNNCGRHDYYQPRIFHREIANGSPLCYALDRLCPPGKDDPFAKHLREIAGHRGVTTDGRWTPAMLDYQH